MARNSANTSANVPVAVANDGAIDFGSMSVEEMTKRCRAILAQIKQIKAQQKATKAAAVNLSEYVIRRLTTRVRALVANGESQDAALDSVLALYRDATISALASAPADADAAQ
jgi:hypothetical protein